MPLVSIVIPVLNDAKGLATVLSEIPRSDLKRMGFDLEVIVVDGNSDDGSPFVARKHGAKVVVEHRRGYGRAYRTGFRHARGDIIVTGDADGQYPFNIVHLLVRAMVSHDVPLVLTSRFERYEDGSFPKVKVFGNKLLTLFFNILFGTKLRDSQSGMWLVRRDLLSSLNLTTNGMEFSSEFKAKAIQRCGKYLEVSIPYRRRYSKSKLRIVRDGFRNLLFMFLVRFELLLRSKQP